ncbi:MAG: hypothetical protein ACK46Q_12550 [Hyphomonas sp.]
MKHNDGCSRLRRVALVLATIWLTGCATVASEPRLATVCPPVVEYTREVQARAAEELNSLPDGTVIAEMIAD